MMFLKHDYGSGWGVGPGICYSAFSALVTLISTQLFYFKLRDVNPAILSSSKTSLGGWGGAMDSRAERRERASPSSITQYLNPIPLELREAGRKMPLPRQPPLLFVGCWLFTRDNVQTWIWWPKHKKRI